MDCFASNSRVKQAFALIDVQSNLFQFTKNNEKRSIVINKMQAMNSGSSHVQQKKKHSK